MLNRSVYQLMESQASYLIVWIGLFFVLSLMRISLNYLNPKKVSGYGFGLSELPGLPLILMHTVCFIKAIMVKDIISALLFAWWGPGFIIVAVIYLYAKFCHRKINWAPFGLITSYACKVNYVIFMMIYFYYSMPLIMFAFSAWIILDQINLAWFSANADRTRRTFEDFWLFRVLYFGFLFIPLFYKDLPSRQLLCILGLSLFICWIAALVKVVRQGVFLNRPSGQDFLRNIIYLSKKYSSRDK